MTKISTFTKQMLFLLAMILTVAVSVPARADGGGTKAIVAIADEPISALSVLPKNATDAANKYYAIRVKKRKPDDAHHTKVDEFQTLGYLHVDNSSHLDLHYEDHITLDASSNYDHAWNIYAVDNNGDGEHSHLVIKNASTGKYINNDVTSAVHLTTQIDVDITTDNVSNYFTMKPYADHFDEIIELDEYEYEHYTGSDKYSEQKDGHTVYYIKRNVDLIDYTKHHIYLNGSDYKIHCDYSGSDWHVTMADGNVIKDYADDGQKDDIVFEIVEVEVADATNTVTYKFNVQGNKGVEYHFYLQDNHVSEFSSLTTADQVATQFQTALTYYNSFSNLQKTTVNGFEHVEVDCKPNFPFLLSKELRSFDDADMNHPLNFFTMSAGAPTDKADGYYIGLENANSDDHQKLIKHGHYNGSGTQESDFSPYYSKLMSDFHRHIDGSLFWYACKATDEIDDPNALRIYLFTTTTHPLIAPDAIHDNEANKFYELNFLEDRASATHNECNHDIFQILPNTISDMPNGFSLQLKSDPTLKIATSHNGGGEPEKTFMNIARGATGLQTRLSANSATDLVNVAINSRGTRNVGGLDPDEFEGWVDDLMTQYRLAYLYPKQAYPPEYDYYNSLNEWAAGWVDYNRLYNLAAILEYYPDYTTFDIKKKYRIELYKEGTGDNKMLSSIDSYMNNGGTAIAGNNMQKAKSGASILSSSDWMAEDASTYWQIYPTEDKTPESGEEVEIAIYNGNVGAFLKQTSSGIEFGNPCTFSDENANSADKFYVKQEDTSDQWVILNHRSTSAEVKKLTVGSNGEFTWVSGYTHGAEIKDYKYDAGNQKQDRWMFSEISAYPMTIKSDWQYASLCLPFPVQVNDANTTVYYAHGSAENDDDKFVATVLMTAIAKTDGKTIIPANTAVIMHNASGATLSLEVQDDGIGTPISNNKFEVVNAQWGVRAVNSSIADKSYYGLANKDTHGVALYPVKATSGNNYLPSNKAFISKENVMAFDTTQAAKEAFRLVFFDTEDGTTTTVDSLTGEINVTPNDGIYYDLSGRRVTAPKRGIYVNSVGKKIIVKR